MYTFWHHASPFSIFLPVADTNTSVIWKGVPRESSVGNTAGTIHSFANILNWFIKSFSVVLIRPTLRIRPGTEELWNKFLYPLRDLPPLSPSYFRPRPIPMSAWIVPVFQTSVSGMV